MGSSRFWLKAADEESKSIPHEFPRFHWLKATGQCVPERYLSATMNKGLTLKCKRDLTNIRKLLLSQVWRERKYFLSVQRSRLNVGGNTLSNHVVDTWNNLPENTVNVPSVNAFKSRLNKHWHRYPTKFDTTSYQTGQPTRGICTQYQEASIHVR